MAVSTILTGLTIAGAAVSAYGIYQQGMAQKSAAEYNSKVAQQNAQIARQQGELRARQQDRLNRLRLGTIRASAGASGGAANEGSVLDIIADNAVQGELQKQEILYESELKARGYEGRKGLLDMEADSAGKGAVIGAAGALIGGAQQSYGMLKRG